MYLSDRNPYASLRLLSVLYVEMHMYRMLCMMLKDKKEWEAKKKKGGGRMVLGGGGFLPLYSGRC